MLGSSGREARQTGCCFIFSLLKECKGLDAILYLLTYSVGASFYFSLRRSPPLPFLAPYSVRDSTISSRFQPYNQKEPPVVRVVEGPLFSEVVAHYQHFQQTIRIHNVPGNKHAKLHNLISSNGFCKSFLCFVKGTRWYNTARANMFDKMTIYNSIKYFFFLPVSCKILCAKYHLFRICMSILSIHFPL